MGNFFGAVKKLFTRAKQKPVVRGFRKFPMFGARYILLHLPSSRGGAMQILDVKRFDDAPVFYEAEGAGFVVKYGVVKDELVFVNSLPEAVEVIDMIAKVIASSRVSYIKWSIIAVIGYLLIASLSGPSGSIVYGDAPVTSWGQRSAPGAVSRLQVPDLTKAPDLAAMEGSVAPLVSVPAVNAESVRPQALQTDVNDPFGLRVVPAK